MRYLPESWDKLEDGARRVAQIVNQIVQGKAINCYGSVTLTASAASTTLTDKRIGVYSVILFCPTTANAATATGNLYVSAKGNGTATLTHTNNAQTDRTFDYVVIG